MRTFEQENTQEVQQENTLSSEIEELSQPPRVTQLVQPKEALDEIAEIEKQYRETVEKMNR